MVLFPRKSSSCVVRKRPDRAAPACCSSMEEDGSRARRRASKSGAIYSRAMGLWRRRWTIAWRGIRRIGELALQWLRAHSDEIGLDGNHICAYGESAGGHIALGLGGPEDKLACIVDAFGPTDLTALTGPAYQRSFVALVGEEDATWQQRLRAASPLFNLKPGFPPVLIVHGESDELIPPEQSTALMDALRRQKTPVMAIMYRGGHSWSHVSALDSASIMNHIILFMKTATER